MIAMLWNDDQGALLSAEWVFLATILVLGVTTGLTAVRNAALKELEEFSNAVGSLSQSYSFGGTSGCCAKTAASSFSDQSNEYPVSTCTPNQDGAGPNCPD